MTGMGTGQRSPQSGQSSASPSPNRKDPTTGTTEAEVSHAPSGLLSSSGMRTATLRDYCKDFVDEVFGSCWQTGKHRSLVRSLARSLPCLLIYSTMSYTHNPRFWGLIMKR